MKRETIDIDQLKRERQKVLDEAAEVLSDANREDRELQPDDQKKYDLLMAEAKKRLTQIQNEDEMRLAESLTDSAGQPVMKPHPSESGSYVGMTKEDISRYSLRRGIAAKAGLVSAKEASLELEISEAVAKRSGKAEKSGSLFVPVEVTGGRMEQRDLSI